jgi:hypothetical protein
MDAQFYKDALFGGMTSNAFKLGTVLSLGWFWVRRDGCAILYRGSSFWTIDFDNILLVTKSEPIEIQVPSYISHEDGQTYYYAVRRANGFGCLELGLQGVAKAAFDNEGVLLKPRPNVVYGLKAEQQTSSSVRLSWYYCPLAQESEPASFNVYSDNGTGEIDYENATAVTGYEGKGFYSCDVTVAGEGRYSFAVRAEDKAGTEGDIMISTIDIISKVCNPPVIADVQAV